LSIRQISTESLEDIGIREELRLLIFINTQMRQIINVAGTARAEQVANANQSRASLKYKYGMMQMQVAEEIIAIKSSGRIKIKLTTRLNGPSFIERFPHAKHL